MPKIPTIRSTPLPPRHMPLLVVAGIMLVGALAFGFTQIAQVPASSCGLASAAFCDTFSAAAFTGGGRTGQLDPARWQVSRLSSSQNPSQGSVNTWIPTTLPLCDTNFGSYTPDNDVKVCHDADGTSYFDEAYNDGSALLINDFMPLQPFDFANRTGTVVFDSDAKTAGGHTWWLDVNITDQPVPSPMTASGLGNTPRNAVQIDFSGCNGAGPNLMGVSNIQVVRNFVTTAASVTDAPNTPCATTADGVRNHIALILSQQTLEVWISDAGGSRFVKHASVANLGLTFSRGYVHYEHAQYNAAKEGVSAQQHYEWTNLAFDGPVLPTPRTYDVPDALGPARDGHSVNLGYTLTGAGVQTGGMQTCCNSGGGFFVVPAFTLPNVNLTGATSAALNMSIDNFSGNPIMSYRFNGGAWHAIAPENPGAFNWAPQNVSVALSDLRQGDNTLEFAGTQSVEFTNVDLTLQTAAGGVPPTTTSTNTPVPATATVPAATATSVPAATATTAPPATATAVPASTATIVLPDCSVVVTVSQHTYSVQPGSGCK